MELPPTKTAQSDTPRGQRRRHSHAVAELIHSHAFSAVQREGERRTAWVTGLTIAAMAVEIAAGWATGSMALLADGWHMGTHAAALGIAWASFAFARRQARNPRFTFGTGKVGILTAFGSSIILGGAALLMFWESTLRLLSPTPIRFNEALAVALIGLAVNIASAWLLGRPDGPGGHPHNHDLHPPRDHNLRAAYFHVLADALTSVLAIAALLTARQWGWLRADPLMGLVGGAIILRWAWSLALDTGRILTDSDLDPAETECIRRAIESDGDSIVTDLHVWRVGAAEQAAIISLVSGQARAPADYRARLLTFPDLRHVSIEVNPCAECNRQDGQPPADRRLAAAPADSSHGGAGGHLPVNVHRQ